MENGRLDKYWYEQANCATTDAEIFFIPRNVTKMAKKVCARCVVREECLTDALKADEQIGFAGGLTAKARKAILKAV